MSRNDLATKAQTYLRQLCVDFPTRRVGTPGNRAATTRFADWMHALGNNTLIPEFDCLDWVSEGASLSVSGQSFDARVSPYSLGCRVTAPLLVVSTLEDNLAGMSRS